MMYEDFANAFMDELQSKIGDDAELKRTEFTKVNNVCLDGISIRLLDSNVAPTIYLNDFYPLYKSGSTVSELVEQAKKLVDKALIMKPAIPEFNLESAKENLYGVLINRERNAGFLKNAIYEPLEDLAFVVRFKVGNEGSVLVTDELLTRFKLTSSEALEIAHKNTDKERFTCKSMGETVMELLGERDISEDYMEGAYAEQENCPMYVITNERKIDGAVAISSDRVLKEAWEKIGGDYYILPSSRHEVIAVPKTVTSDVNLLKSMVSEVNATTVEKIDLLGNSIYLYNGRSLSRADSQKEIITDIITAAKNRPHVMAH